MRHRGSFGGELGLAGDAMFGHLIFMGKRRAEGSLGACGTRNDVNVGNAISRFEVHALDHLLPWLPVRY